jgi:protein TonB
MTATSIDLSVPWVRGREDALFNGLTVLAIPLFIVLLIWLNGLDLAEREGRDPSTISPVLTRLVLDEPPDAKKEPELEKIVPPLETVPPVVEQAPETVPEPTPVEPAKLETARQRASRAGLLAFSDQFADLREQADLGHLDASPLQGADNGASAEVITSSHTEALHKRSVAGSGGLADSQLAREQNQLALAARKELEVHSKLVEAIADGQQALAERERQQQLARPIINARSRDEVEKVFQLNKGPIYSIYNRALRHDPKLQGKIIVELTIAPDGEVTHCALLSSELANEDLEKRLVARIKRFRFAEREVTTTTVTYPIDFLPS